MMWFYWNINLILTIFVVTLGLFDSQQNSLQNGATHRLYYFSHMLTLKHRETHGCVVSTVATDALVLKHQAISILSTD